MKLITSLLGSLALTFVTLALAQEESPTASPEEKASTAAQETAAPTPAAAEAKATESPAAAPGTGKKETPSKAAAERSPSPAAAKAAAAPFGKRMSVDAALKDSENRWEAAIAKHDAATIGSMVADDFVGVYYDGKVMSRSGVIGEAKKDRDTYKSAVNEKLAVHTYGPNVAVVIGTAHEKGTAKDGKPFDRRFRFTDTWVERGGRWQCVASQVLKLP